MSENKDDGTMWVTYVTPESLAESYFQAIKASVENPDGLMECRWMSIEEAKKMFPDSTVGEKQ